MKRLKEARSGDASQGYEFLKEMITTQTVDKVLNKNFDEVVVQLLMRMYEPPDEGSDIATFSRESDPEPNPPFFTSYAIKATLEYMTRCYPGETVVSVLCKNKTCIPCYT
ncbi:predicted protein [Nematostella vectensis]|uniref:Uncharacterized protein n=1 Tax=Nematostella vectensis TaxID=45351 RepID=A8DVB6_NEMVE|nr:predicted protein [Nematostella vectensis]|eukprot:XP_001618009.1 hypothetical protein NEMVEDRAFT_v1g225594 [Nematostella vectensis]